MDTPLCLSFPLLKLSSKLPAISVAVTTVSSFLSFLKPVAEIFGSYKYFLRFVIRKVKQATYYMKGAIYRRFVGGNFFGNVSLCRSNDKKYASNLTLLF